MQSPCAFVSTTFIRLSKKRSSNSSNRCYEKRHFICSVQPLPHVVILPGMDGSGILLDEFTKTMRLRDNSRRVECVQYPRDAHLGYDALSRYVQDHYIYAIPDDGRGIAIVSQSYSAHVGFRLDAKARIYVNGFAGPPFRSTLPLWKLFPEQLFQVPPPSWLASLLFLNGDCAAMRKVQLEGANVNPEVMALRLRDCLSEDSWHRWRNTKLLPGHSTLYLRGLSDPIVGSREISHKMRRAREDITWVDVENGPHLLLQQFGAKCAHIVDDFLESRVVPYSFGS